MVKILLGSAEPGAGAYMALEDGKRYKLPMAPSSFDLVGVAETTRTARRGAKAVTRHTADGVDEISFQSMVYALNRDHDVEAELLPFRDAAKAKAKVRFTGVSTFWSYRWWIITEWRLEGKRLNPQNKVSGAVLHWTLTEHVAVTSTVAGGVKPGTVTVKPAETANGVTPGIVVRAQSTGAVATRQHTVARGDTLGSIAARYLGSPLRWREVWELNKSKVRDPDRVEPGLVLTVPTK